MLSIRHLFIVLLLLVVGANSVVAQTASWTPYKADFFPTNASGQIHGISRVSQMKFHPTNSQKMYAVSARGGLFISSNAGTSWSVAPGCDNLTLNTRFASVCIDHTNDQTIYLGGGDHNYYSNGSGVWKSTNGGTTFTQTTLTGKIIVEMIMDPNNNQIIVAATNTGIYKTTNAGSTWTLKSGNIAFDDMVRKANTTSRVLFASTRNAELYISNDFGETWTQITSGIYIPSGYSTGGGTRIGVTPADSNYVYFYMNAKGGTLFRSTNGGTSFSAVKDNLSPFLTGYTNSSADPGQGDYNTGLGIDRTNRDIVYFVAHNVWKSTNGGSTWTQLTVWYQKVHTDMHQVVVSPYNTTQLWNMNDGGVWLSTDGGNNWTPKSDGLYGYEIYHGSCSPTRRDMMSIGTQDNGELYATSTTWYTNRGGDWQSHCVFDYRSNSSMVYYYLPDWGDVNLPKRRLVNGSEAAYGLPASVTDFSDIAFHRSNSNLAFVGDTVVWRTTNLTAGSPTWSNIFNTGTTIMKMHMHFSDPNRLYVITADQKIHISSNAQATTPTFTTVSLPNAANVEAHITSIKTNNSVIYITTNTRVYRSADNGATWTNITYNLPSYNHTAIIADEFFSSNELVFVATGGAVYYKTASATTWTLYSTGLPSRTTIVDMSIYNDSTANTALRAFTYGRGVFETPISNLRSMTANFAADNTKPCVGGVVNFSDLSTGNVVSRTWSFPGGTPSTSTSATPAVTYSTIGNYDVTLTVSNGTTSSTITQTAYISTVGRQLTVTEGFEDPAFPPTYWNNVDAGNDAKAWARFSGAGGFGTTTNSMYYDNYSVDAAGAYDEFRSASIDITAYSSATLKFDVAYQPYSLTTYVDSLQVLVSTNCGASFTSVYLKYGSSLNTTGTTNTSEFIPTSTQWRQETISLNSFVGNNVIVAFRNIGRYGNNLYVDNILLVGTPITVSAGVDKTICSGAATTIGSSSITGMTYSWSPATGLSSSTVSNPTASPTATTTYILTATYTPSGYTSKDTVVVTVNNGPAVSIAAVAPLCANAAPVTLNYSPPTATITGTGVSGGQFNPGVGAGTYTVTATATGANGCSSSASTNITVNTLSISGVTTNATCFGSANGTIDISPSAGSGNYSYSWSNAATTQDLTSLTPGAYSITATDITTGCTASATYTITEPSAIIISSCTPSSGASGTVVTITGSNFIGVTDVRVNNVSIGSTNYVVNSTTQITMTVTAAMTSGAITVVCGGCGGSSTTSFIKTGINFSIRCLIQGYYIGSGAMRTVLLNQGVVGATNQMSDTVIVSIYSPTNTTIPVATRKIVLTHLGTGAVSFPTTPVGDYWIAVSHRNAIETWAATVQSLNTTSFTYNFTNAANKAYGNNMVELATNVWGFYSGDLPIQNALINLGDFNAIESAFSGAISGYNAFDLNGDGLLESSDYSLLENNVAIGVQVIKP
jgi:PKD repeat protein